MLTFKIFLLFEHSVQIFKKSSKTILSMLFISLVLQSLIKSSKRALWVSVNSCWSKNWSEIFSFVLELSKFRFTLFSITIVLNLFDWIWSKFLSSGSGSWYRFNPLDGRFFEALFGFENSPKPCSRSTRGDAFKAAGEWRPSQEGAEDAETAAVEIISTGTQ